MVVHSRVPDGLPTLSRVKHRTPRKGACFMEMASVLANEPWSDKPRCTDPLLAQLARLVNDHSTDAHRSDLAVMIPSVIGVHGTGLAWDVQLVAAVAGNAVPDVPEYLQPVVTAVPLQLLAYHIALLRGCDVDKPRNLAKSVTVE